MHPERPDARLRVELQRRQPAGARLGDAVPLPHRAGPRATSDLDFLERSFHKLLLNFTWWVNRKDRSGRNVFDGGFLGLDNIGVFDRSAPLPTGGYLEQADGTAWMAFFCQNMLEIALELAAHDPRYEEYRVQVRPSTSCGSPYAMDRIGDNQDEMWDEEDGFYYDVLRLPDGSARGSRCARWSGCCRCARPRVRAGAAASSSRDSPSCIAADSRALSRSSLRQVVHRRRRLRGLRGPPTALAAVDESGSSASWLRMLDENEFLSPYGIRSLSRYHERASVHLQCRRHRQYRVATFPAESDTGMFGGNSNWRGPVWMPVNALIVRGLLNLYCVLRRRLQGRMPDRLGRADDPVRGGPGDRATGSRRSSCATRRASGRCTAGPRKFQDDPHWRDYVLFYEYFHGDNGAGLGASHQTGWTGTIARLMDVFGTSDPGSRARRDQVARARAT